MPTVAATLSLKTMYVLTYSDGIRRVIRFLGQPPFRRYADTEIIGSDLREKGTRKQNTRGSEHYLSSLQYRCDRYKKSKDTGIFRGKTYKPNMYRQRL